MKFYLCINGFLTADESPLALVTFFSGVELPTGNNNRFSAALIQLNCFNLLQIPSLIHVSTVSSITQYVSCPWCHADNP